MKGIVRVALFLPESTNMVLIACAVNIIFKSKSRFWLFFSTVIWRFIVKRCLAVWVELSEVAPDSEEETEMHASDETLWQSQICIQEGVRLRVT